MPRDCKAIPAVVDSLSHAVGDTHPLLRHGIIPALRHASRDAPAMPHEGFQLINSELVREVD
ncbi:MAG: hypothetical protein OXQ84_13040 [bacterium]|nr:hypothetical protein [bacterium]